MTEKSKELNTGPNVFIEFDILTNSDQDILEREFQLLINGGRLIYLWSKHISIEDMANWIRTANLQDYIWGYKVKDSFNYGSPDFVIDNDKRVVDRFQRQGIPGNVIERL